MQNLNKCCKLQKKNLLPVEPNNVETIVPKYFKEGGPITYPKSVSNFKIGKAGNIENINFQNFKIRKQKNREQSFSKLYK